MNSAQIIRCVPNQVINTTSLKYQYGKYKDLGLDVWACWKVRYKIGKHKSLDR